MQGKVVQQRNNTAIAIISSFTKSTYSFK